MRLVSTQEELDGAIRSLETDIVVAAGFSMDFQQNIGYAAVITSASDGPYTLTKAEGYDGALFQIQNGGSLTLQNILLDGAGDTHTTTGDSRSLVLVPGGTLILEAGSVLQNNRGYEGGAVNAEPAEGAASSVIVRDGAVIRGNYSYNNGGGIRAVFNAPGSLLQFSGQPLIEDNTSNANGGGIYYESYQQDRLVIGGNTQISRNSAASGGGGIEIIRASARFAGNVLIDANTARGSGGGIDFRGSGLLIEDGVKIQNNQADSSGGGVYASPQLSASTTIHGQITDNSGGSGGGVYVEAPDNGTLDFSRAQLISNRAVNGFEGYGGGVRIYRRAASGTILSIAFDDAVFDLNHSNSDGGGLQIDYPGLSGPAQFFLSMSGCSFKENISSRYGGGMCITGQGNSIAQLENCVFTGNQAGWGGGFYASMGAGSALSLLLQNVSFTQNICQGYGGGIHFSGGEINAEFIGVTITQNRGGQGGGFCSYDPSGSDTGRITMEAGAQITGNQADNGGGVFQYGSRSLYYMDVTLSNNSAGSAGQDVYVTGLLHAGPAIIASNGVFLSNDRNSTVEIDVPLTSDSIIQLELSDRVTPNPSGTPILIAQAAFELTAQDLAAFRKPETGFDGWEPRLGGGNDQIFLSVAVYELRYENTRGAENPNPSSYTVLTPTITLAELPNIPEAQFTGWFDSLEGGNQITEIPLGSTGNKTLYARWRNYTHTVTYYPNDAGGPAAENIPLPQTVLEGNSVTVSGQLPTRTGYVFTGWNTDPAGAGTAYQPGETIASVLADIGLYAQWEAEPPRTYLLTYEPNDAEGPPAQDIPGQREITEGETVELSPAVPSRSGYRFLNWNSAPDGSGTVYQPGQEAGPFYEELTLYAQWMRIAYTLTYYGNDQGGPPAQWIPFPQPMLEGQTVRLSSAVPTREGFLFTSWNTQPDGGGGSYQPGNLFGPAVSDASLYAQWAPLPPPVYFTLAYCPCDAGGPPASCIPCPQRIVFGERARIPCCFPCRAGCRFAGWNTCPCGTGRGYWPGQYLDPVTGNVCLYAQWRRQIPCPPSTSCDL